MKTRILLILLCLAVNFHLFAQNPACDKVFNFYAGTKGLLTLNVSENLLTELFADGKMNDDFNISSIKILVVEDTALNSKLNFYKEVVPNLNKKEFEELMTVKNSERDLVMLRKKHNQKITEFILVSGGNDNFLIYIKGNLSLSNLNKISQVVFNPDNFKKLEKESRN